MLVFDWMKLYFQDRVSVRCNKGFRLIGTNIISCGEDQEFVDLPECVDIDECANANPCDFSSTECVNTKVSAFIFVNNNMFIRNV